MELCSDGHDEVCYEGGYNIACPACEAIKDLEAEHEKSDDAKNDQLSELNDIIEELKSELAEAKNND